MIYNRYRQLNGGVDQADEEKFIPDTAMSAAAM
jgi:hypothetical protein